MPNEFDLKNIHGLVIDMDGVLWRGNSAIPGLNEFFDFMHRRRLPFMLATNNATKTPEQYLHKLAGFGVRTVTRDNILTSSLATAAYLQRDHRPGSKVYIVGQDGLRQAMQEAGFMIMADAGQPVEVVVAGADFTLTYDKLKYAAFLIRGGARFVGTNGDLTFPSEEGLIPGAGSILAALEAATGVKPVTVGKPARLMFDLAIEKMDTRPEQTAMLGDRLETDILGGQQAGLKTILVTTGIDNEAAIVQKGIQPDAVFSGIAELVEVWKTQG
ncbi:MAG: HAD-IIA family hydrolase [Chloroflexota bacterium]